MESALGTLACGPLLVYVGALSLLFLLRAAKQCGLWTSLPSTKGSSHVGEPRILDNIPLEERLHFFCFRTVTYPVGMLCGLIASAARLLQVPVGLGDIPDDVFAAQFSDSLLSA